MSSTDVRDLEVVRHEVKGVLEQSDAWRRLGADERAAFANNMVRVAHYLAKDPGWLDAPVPAGESPAVAEALGPIDDLQKRLAKAPGQVGQEFEAGAMRQGVQEFGNLVRTVDFPEFVSGLIQGVFQAIVDASIQQMEAFGELLAATAKTVEQFAQDHISDDAAREQIATRYPSLVKIERTTEGGTRLAAREEAEDMSALQQITRSSTTVDFDDDESERKLVLAAKLEMARQRQKMMALMVLLGINRIVVTNGRINAKVVFDVEASDYAKRHATASLEDRREEEKGAVATAALPWGAAGGYSRSKHKATVRSAIDDQSEAKAQMKAQLAGEVRVNFRSETLPPERMLDALQLEQFNFMSQTGGANPAAANQPAGSRNTPAANTAPSDAAPAGGRP